MKKIAILYPVLLLLAAFMVTGCSDDDEKAPAATFLNVYRDSTAIEQLSFQVPANSVIIGVECDADWTASVDDESWATISNHAGYGSTIKRSYVRVSVLKNEGEARTATITFRSGNLTKTVSIAQKGTGTDPGDTFLSSFSTVEDFVLGYNLGNTLDSNPHGDWWNPEGKTPTDWETAWGQPVTTPALINAIAERGFNVIRIPVTWAPHMDANDVVDAAWMARVKEVVDMVIGAGCYCILNVQHDTGSDETAWLQANMETYPTSSVRFKKLWTQIANTFRDYGDHLLFEAFNEILYTNSNAGWTPPAVGSESYKAIRLLHQDFVDAVRATGGNNEYRNLVINPYAGGNSQVVLDEMALPEDKHSNHILLSVHSYDPYNFCNDNGEWSILIFDQSCMTEIDGVFSRVLSRASDLGIPAFFGEFGAIDGQKSSGERIKYAKYLAQKFKDNGTSGLWWMGLIDRTTLSWYESEVVDALFEGLK